MWWLTLCLTSICFGSSRNARCVARNATWNREPCVIMEKSCESCQVLQLPSPSAYCYETLFYAAFKRSVSNLFCKAVSFLQSGTKCLPHLFAFSGWFDEATEISMMVYNIEIIMIWFIFPTILHEVQQRCLWIFQVKCMWMSE